MFQNNARDCLIITSELTLKASSFLGQIRPRKTDRVPQPSVTNTQQGIKLICESKKSYCQAHKIYTHTQKLTKIHTLTKYTHTQKLTKIHTHTHTHTHTHKHTHTHTHKSSQKYTHTKAHKNTHTHKKSSQKYTHT